jgi:hypothetical protein
MRRVHLKGRDNILKRLLVHAGGFNLALIMRKLVGIGKPRRLQGACACIFVWPRPATSICLVRASNRLPI